MTPLHLTALASLVRLRINAGCYKDVVAGRGLDGVSRLLEGLARHDPVDVGQDSLECRLDVRGVQRRSLDERQSVLSYCSRTPYM